MRYSIDIVYIYTHVYMHRKIIDRSIYKYTFLFSKLRNYKISNELMRFLIGTYNMQILDYIFKTNHETFYVITATVKFLFY